MIEIRVIGTPGDVEAVLAALQASPGLDMVRVSREYASRGTPGLVRRYATGAVAHRADAHDELSPQQQLPALLAERYGRQGGTR